MSDIDKPKRTIVLGKSPGSALRRPLPGLPPQENQDVDRVVNVDVIPVPLGIEGRDGLMIPVFIEGTTIPCEHVLAVLLHRGISGDFDLSLCQGYSTCVRHNVSLARFCVRNDSVPANQWLARVKLAVTIAGVLTVNVTDPDTKQLCEVRLEEFWGGLSDDDVAEWKRKAQGRSNP